MRTLKFTMIADSRFSDDLVSELSRLKYGVADKLEELPDVNFIWKNQRILTWKDGSEQRRITFHVQKHSRKTTWNDIYRAVNSVKAVPYDFIQRSDISEEQESPFYQPI